MKNFILACLILSTLCFACGEEDPIEESSVEFFAKINGSDHDLLSVNFKTNQQYEIVTAFGSAETMMVGARIGTLPGTYSVTSSVVEFTFATINGPAGVYIDQQAGEIVILENSDTRFRGTFNVNVFSVGNEATPEFMITEGEFNLEK